MLRLSNATLQTSYNTSLGLNSGTFLQSSGTTLLGDATNSNWRGTSALTVSGGVFSGAAWRGSTGFADLANDLLTLTFAGGTSTFYAPSATRGASAVVNVNFDGGVFRPGASSSNFWGSATNAANMYVGNNGALIDTNTFNLTFAQPMVNGTAAGTVGFLTKLGSGTLTLSGSNSYSGNTRISAGALSLGNANALAGSTLDMNSSANDSGSLVFGVSGTNTYNIGGLIGSRNIVTSGSVVMSVGANAASGTYSGVISGGGAFTKVGAGALTLANANSFTGTTTIAGGSLRIGDGGSVGALGASSVITGSAGATLVFNRTDAISQASQFANGITGDIGVSNIASGTLTLSSSNSYTGGTTLSLGQLNINHASALGTGTFTIGGGAIDNTSAGAVTLATNNPQAWNADFTFVGTKDLNLGTGSVSLSADRQVSTTAGTLTVGGAIGGNFGLRKAGGGTLVLSGSNSYSGQTRVSAGVLTLGASNAISDQSNVLVDGGGFNLAGFDETVGTVRLTSGSIFGSGTLTGSSYALEGGIVSANLGAGAVNVGGNSTLSGIANGSVVNLNSGTLSLSGGGSLANTAAVNAIASGATLDISGLTASGLTVGSLSGSAGAIVALGGKTLTFGDGNATTFAGSIRGTGGITKQGSGVATFSGSNAFSGSTTINAGSISFSDKSAFSATSGIGIAGGAGLAYTGAADTFSRNITVTSGTGTVTNSGSGVLTLGGTLTKNGTVLRLTGAGGFNVTGQIVGTSSNSDLYVDGANVTLSSANSYNGPTVVYNGGVLTLGTNAAIPSNSAVTLGGPGAGTLDLAGFTNSIGGLAFAGSGGTLRMAANQTAAAQLVTGSSLSLGAGTTLDLTGMATTAGLYRLVSATALTGTFGTVTGLNSNYVLRYNTVNPNEIGAQRKADQAATFAMTTGTIARALVNTNVAVSGTVSNSSPADSTALTLGLASTGLTGSGFTTGSVTADSSLAVSGFLSTGSAAGTQSWTITNTDNDAIRKTSTVTGSLQVVNQREFTVTGGTIALGTFLRTLGQSGAATFSSSGLNASTANASLDGFNGTSTNGFGLSLASGSTNFFGAESPQQTVYSLSGSAASAGVISGSFSSNVTAEFGSIGPLTISLTGTALDPAVASFEGGLTPTTVLSLDFGELNQGTGLHSLGFSLFNLMQTSGYTADLALLPITSGTGNTGAIWTDLATFNNLLSGSSYSYSASIATDTLGAFTNTYTLAFKSAKNNTAFSGDTTQNLTLTVTGMIIVPEPGAIMLAGLGIAMAGWSLSKRRRYPAS